ncbi:hypothetical protein SAMN05421837_109104 [Amycolatopsis pretoriensis]|uniref:Uncharacterized protein n=1 Tax=Amycolatopsis pretoriensis TaxID=218821 RepID=A0A1H5REK8_9PSEU|nr:hypothetical protein [Amycolatopsis pretoriensis]SEF35947.1 hypothetical protein SAMN05421837_109104 [Amycolatopsis pretoriensis]
MTVRVTATSATRSQPLWWARLRTPKGRETIRADSASAPKAAR